MAVSLQTVESALDQAGLPYFALGPDSIALAPFSAGDVSVEVGLSLAEEGEYLQVRTFGLIHFPDGHPRLGAALECIGRLNEKFRLVKMGWDPKDGEVSVEVGFPLADNPTLPASQLRRVLAGVGLCSRDLHRELSSLTGVPEIRRVTRPSLQAPAPEPRAGANPTKFLVALAIVLFGVAAVLVAVKQFVK